MNQVPKFIIIDLFCGAGGTTLGFEMAKNGIAKVIACVNHDPKAIKSHWANHPDVKHFEEDILTLDLTELISLTNHYRKLYPEAKVILWASLECTNFSKAKGGQPRDADSRTLAWGLPRYIDVLKPDYIQIENVVEFMSWGPLIPKMVKVKGCSACALRFDKDEKRLVGHWIPESKNKGKDWMKWREFICEEFGYRDQWKELNSADFGAYTSRNRLFGVFAKDNLPIAFPLATHAKIPSATPLFDNLQQWKAVKYVLDFDDKGASIFNRKKDLVDASLERIYAGLIKFVAGGKHNFTLKHNGHKVENLHTEHSAFLTKYHKTGENVLSIESAASTITTKDRMAKVECFLTKYNSGRPDNKIQSIDVPSATLTTSDRMCKVKTEYWIDKQYSGPHNHQSIDQPAGVVMTNDKHRIVQAEPFIVNTNFNNTASSIEVPSPTIVASRRYLYLLNPSHGGHTQSVENPCPVVVARQDKAPLYLINAECGSYQVPVYETDSSVTIKIKEFMSLYGIVDIKMRMLKVPELLSIQGFPSKYKLIGSKKDKKKFIGNSVVPLVVKYWIEALANLN